MHCISTSLVAVTALHSFREDSSLCSMKKSHLIMVTVIYYNVTATQGKTSSICSLHQFISEYVNYIHVQTAETRFFSSSLGMKLSVNTMINHAMNVANIAA